jgi:hypothetical protein
VVPFHKVSLPKPCTYPSSYKPQTQPISFFLIWSIWWESRRKQLVALLFLPASWYLSYAPGSDSASNRNEYQEFSLGGKGGRCVGLTTLPPSRADCLRLLRASTSWNPKGLSRFDPCYLDPLTPKYWSLLPRPSYSEILIHVTSSLLLRNIDPCYLVPLTPKYWSLLPRPSYSEISFSVLYSQTLSTCTPPSLSNTKTHQNKKKAWQDKIKFGKEIQKKISNVANFT